MSGKELLIPEITPMHKKWTSKVIIAEKSYPKTAFYGSKKYQTLLLMDIEGNTVKGMIWDHHIPAFETVLILGNTYLISNALVRLTPDKYKKFDGELQWTLSGTTKVEKVEEVHHDIIFRELHLSPFHDLRNYMDDKTKYIGIIAIVLDVKPKRPFYTKTGNQVTVQDIVLMNREFNTITLTMWSSFIDNEAQEIVRLLPKTPVLVATHLLVTSFNGLSLSTTSDSFFYVNFPFDEVTEYQKWICDNSETIAEMTSLKPYFTPKKISPLEDTQFTSVEDVLDLAKKLQQSHFWIKGSAKIKMASAPFWYMSCSLCYRSSCASIAGESYDCRYCNTLNVTALPRARANIYIEDETGKLAASLMGEIAEDYLQCSAFKLMEISKGRLADEGNIRLDIDDQYIFYIKASPMTQSPTDHGKAPATFSQTSTHKFEVIYVEEYVSDKFKQPHSPIQKEQLPTMSESNSSCTAVSHSVSPPPVKRNLFPADGTLSPTKKVER